MDMFTIVLITAVVGLVLYAAYDAVTDTGVAPGWWRTFRTIGVMGLVVLIVMTALALS